jgi:hypothetical protein
MKKLGMIAVILLVAVMSFSYTSELSEDHEGFKGEPLATFNRYAEDTKEEIVIAKIFVYAPDQISDIDMPEETIAIIYFRITDHTYMEIYGMSQLVTPMGEFKVKGILNEEYKKYERTDEPYDAYFIDERFSIWDSKFGMTSGARSDRSLYYICSPLIDKTKEYTVYLKFGEETGDVIVNKNIKSKKVNRTKRKNNF